jgi:ribosomal protein S18 acetylase RimI-like enzyme
MSYAVRALDTGTWRCFADLVERHRGVWGGCWCMGFHSEGVGKDTTYELNRDRKLARVRAGTTHAALVLDGDTCVGWCQYGATDELPRIKNRRAYDAGATDAPDWRITCFFVDSAHRRRGVAEAALSGALDLIAAAGGGVVESYPEDTTDRKVSSSFLHNATVSVFEAHGFTRVRRIGKDRWVVRRTLTGNV